MRNRCLGLLAGLLLAAAPLGASEIPRIASGAGYKKPLQKILARYTATHGIKIDAVYGNMKQITAQARHTDIALLIGDRSYLKEKSRLPFDEFIHLGQGKLVLAYAKGKTLHDTADLAKPEITAVATPHPSKAIYGIAADAFLHNSRLYGKIKDKLRVVATVPQVVAYVTAREVDAGLINLTAALAHRKWIGGYIEVPRRYYPPIEIVAGRLTPCLKNPECIRFLAYLQSNDAKAVWREYGL